MNLFKVKNNENPGYPVKCNLNIKNYPSTPQSGNLTRAYSKDFGYELLTATTLIYAIRAGITAAAGTRLSL